MGLMRGYGVHTRLSIDGKFLRVSFTFKIHQAKDRVNERKPRHMKHEAADGDASNDAMHSANGLFHDHLTTLKASDHHCNE
jgi:hypothetical protein